MFQFTSTATEPPSTLYMGRDKYENDLLIKYSYGENDVWFHVDKFSSAHLYLRLIPGLTWDNLPQALLRDCAQLVKYNSIEGNKTNNVDIIYTPWSNLKKTQGMDVGEVSFHKQTQVRRYHIDKRDNTIINRLQRTKVELVINYEEDKTQRDRDQRAILKNAMLSKKKEQTEALKAEETQKKLESYADLFQSSPTGMDFTKYGDDFF